MDYLFIPIGLFKFIYIIHTPAFFFKAYCMFSFIGCTTTKYVPIENIRTEHINKI